MLRDWTFVGLGLSGALALAGCGGGNDGGNSGSGGGPGTSGGSQGVGGGSSGGSPGNSGGSGTIGSSGGNASGGGGASGGASPSGQANCPDFCARMLTCWEQLCAEDGAPLPEVLLGLLEATCSPTCTAQFLEGMEPHWDCYMESSCRAVFGEDSCQTDSRYSCLDFPD